MTPIQTERLVLRPYVDSDAERIHAILSRMDVIRWLGDPPYVPMVDAEAARAWIERWAAREVADPFELVRAIEIRDTGVVAGSVIVARAERHDEGFAGEYEIGWHLHPDSHGHGYATEAARAMLDDVFARGIADVWCDMFPDNLPSQRVAERLGLPALGVMPDPWYEGDGRIFHVTREQWLDGPDRDLSGESGTIEP